MNNHNIKPLTLALTAAFALSASSAAFADSARDYAPGQQKMTENGKSMEGHCGAKGKMKGKDGKCGKGKMKGKDGKCGKGKMKGKDAKCGEGKCGKGKDGSCGGDKDHNGDDDKE